MALFAKDTEKRDESGHPETGKYDENLYTKNLFLKIAMLGTEQKDSNSSRLREVCPYLILQVQGNVFIFAIELMMFTINSSCLCGSFEI